MISTEAQLEDIMTAPSPVLVEMMKRLPGDLVVLGIAGKMGATLGLTAARACRAAGLSKKVLGVSRFSEAGSRAHLDSLGIETMACDLLDPASIKQLPKIENVIFMAGRKFGTQNSKALTWAMNTAVPAYCAEHFAASRIVAFSTGCVYPLSPVDAGGSREEDSPDPVGEYAQSCLGREGVFTYFSQKHKTPLVLLRLNYAIDLHYGVLLEIGQKVWNKIPIDLTMGHVNVIWQGDANTQALLALEQAAVPPKILNITGPETVAIRWIAQQFGDLFGRQPLMEGTEMKTALLNNSSRATRLFGPPTVSLQQMIMWTAHWIQKGGKTLDQPTHFEARNGQF